MKIKFILEIEDGIVGEFHYDWQCPFVPRVGERVHIENIFNEGKFIRCTDKGMASKTTDVEYCVKAGMWDVKYVTWCKHDDYFISMGLYGE